MQTNRLGEKMALNRAQARKLRQICVIKWPLHRAAQCEYRYIQLLTSSFKDAIPVSFDQNCLQLIS